MTKSEIEQAKVRSELAQDVTLPIDKWKEILQDLEVLEILKEHLYISLNQITTDLYELDEDDVSYKKVKEWLDIVTGADRD